ncbi:MAG: cupin domain-containing protein [Rhodobacteraceae bacterium]|nr:cupin domain-containing protein [Paracoccaceae bacterium]
MRDEATREGGQTWMGSSYRSLLAAAQTAGRMSITDSTTDPGVGPPRHIHHAEDEAFVVLTGEVEFWTPAGRIRRGPGGTAFIPRGTEHTFRVTSELPSRHLVILTPAGFEGFFAAMVRSGFRIPEDMGRIAEVAARYNLEFTGPPLAAG